MLLVSGSTGEDDAEYEFLAHIENGNKIKPIWLKPRVQETLKMGMDTGSKYSLLSMTLYKEHFSHM